jgi:hypothetical protein
MLEGRSLDDVARAIRLDQHHFGIGPYRVALTVGANTERFAIICDDINLSKAIRTDLFGWADRRTRPASSLTARLSIAATAGGALGNQRE